MRLDPDNQKVLDLIIAAGRPPIASLEPPAAREVYRGGRKFLMPDPPDVDDMRDMDATGPLGAIPLRYYRGQGAPKENAPALVFYHGGGWVIGDRDTHDYVCRKLANEAKCVVVSVDYRLAPEHKFPAAVIDSHAALQWIVVNAATLGIDAKRVAVGGDSAGGNLSAVMAHMARDGDAPALCFQVLLYPGCDMGMQFSSYGPQFDRFPLNLAAIKYFMGHYLNGPADVDDWRASPLRAKSFKDLAPAFVLTAGFDPLWEEGKAYAKKLEEAEAQVSFVHLADQMHGFLTQGRIVRAADMALEMAAAAMRHAFGR
ncbi:carboxylesterase NlhH [Variibacter gotjawalensis]|uniref:Carboxylesterase NlhH n=1 Tax=Variibacter gotjawalensis TaxID=1333996 RepID=A0A0S3PZK7_9BRAD|nr:alpha/beta hydrolase [Variibacter gotjawalensis]NIK47220.1 acetyl esterase [Variibacter gotjawalensis]RZS49120.1 acetyl esterase [Variibacter gotjawalensis]BAT61382.1 carboxylesterase NlhH [Variibacter gotjawalensis]